MTEQEFRKQFARRLELLMEDRGISRQELTNRTGISAMTISRYLNAKHTAQIDIIVKIAKALSCTVDELVN